MGKCSNAFFSETTNMIKAKLYMNGHWMVLYKLYVFCSDMKLKMAATAGSEHIIGPGSHIEYSTRTKNSNFVEDHLRNIPAKFGSNWLSGFGGLTLDPMGKMFQNASSLKPLRQLKPNCPGMIIGRSSTNLGFLCRSEIKDGCHHRS
jgi:hypothetical protein